MYYPFYGEDGIEGFSAYTEGSSPVTIGKGLYFKKGDYKGTVYITSRVKDFKERSLNDVCYLIGRNYEEAILKIASLHPSAEIIFLNRGWISQKYKDFLGEALIKNCIINVEIREGEAGPSKFFFTPLGEANGLFYFYSRHRGLIKTRKIDAYDLAPIAYLKTLFPGQTDRNMEKVIRDKFFYLDLDPEKIKGRGIFLKDKNSIALNTGEEVIYKGVLDAIPILSSEKKKKGYPRPSKDAYLRTETFLSFLDDIEFETREEKELFLILISSYPFKQIYKNLPNIFIFSDIESHAIYLFHKLEKFFAPFHPKVVESLAGVKKEDDGELESLIFLCNYNEAFRPVLEEKNDKKSFIAFSQKNRYLTTNVSKFKIKLKKPKEEDVGMVSRYIFSKMFYFLLENGVGDIEFRESMERAIHFFTSALPPVVKNKDILYERALVARPEDKIIQQEILRNILNFSYSEKTIRSVILDKDKEKLVELREQGVRWVPRSNLLYLDKRSGLLKNYIFKEEPRWAEELEKRWESKDGKIKIKFDSLEELKIY